MVDTVTTPKLTISDAAPLLPQLGDLWWDSGNGILFVRYDDGNSIQWVSSVPVNQVNVASILPNTIIESPILIGIPTAPTAPKGTHNLQIANTEFVDRDFAKLDSPHFIGEPEAPTPSTFDESNKLATTAFVHSFIIHPPSLADDAIPLSYFVPVGDAHEVSEDSWVLGPSGDPTDGINAWINACISSKRWGKASSGNFLVPKGNRIWKWNNLRGLHIFGEGDNTNFIHADPVNGTGLFRFGTNRIDPDTGKYGTYVEPQLSGIKLTEPTSSGSIQIKVTSTAGLFAGETIVLVDPTQPIFYHVVPPEFQAGTIGETIKIRNVLDDGITLELDGPTEFDYNVDTLVGYLHNPVNGLMIRQMKFSYDKGSYLGGVNSAVIAVGCDGLRMEDLTVHNARSRAFTVTNCIDSSIHGIRSRAFNNIDSFHEPAGCINMDGWCSGAIVADVQVTGGWHAIGFTGDEDKPGPANMVFDNFSTADILLGINSHWNMRDITFNNCIMVGSTKPWDIDNDPDTLSEEQGIGLGMRGWRGIRVTNCTAKRFPVGFATHSGTDNAFINNVADDCGRGILTRNGDKIRIDGFLAKNCRYYGADIEVTLGPTLGFPKFSGMVFKDIHIVGHVPSIADFRLVMSQHVPSELKRLGWVFGPMSRNGEAAVCVGEGSAGTMWTNADYLPSPGGEIGGQTVGPFVPTEIVTGAVSATVNIASVVRNYQPYERLPLAGGTYTTPASIRVLTTQLKSFNVAPIIRTGDTTVGSARVTNAPPPGGDYAPGLPFTTSIPAFPVGTTIRPYATVTGSTNGDDPEPLNRDDITNVDTSGLAWAVGMEISDVAGDLEASTGIKSINGTAAAPLPNSIQLTSPAHGTTLANVFTIKTFVRGTSKVPGGGTWAASANATATTADNVFTINKSLGHAVNDIIAVNGGKFTARATIKVDSVDVNGTILTASLVDGGRYIANGPVFTQFSTTGVGTGARFDTPIFAPLDIQVFKTGEYSVVPSNPVTHEPVFTGDTVNDLNLVGTYTLGGFTVNIKQSGGGAVTLPADYIGQPVVGTTGGTGIPAGAIITSVTPAGTLTMNLPATVARTNHPIAVRLSSDAAIAVVPPITVIGRAINVVPDPIAVAFSGLSISDSAGDMANDMTITQIEPSSFQLSRPVTGATVGDNFRVHGFKSGRGALFTVTWGNCIDLGILPKVGVDVVDAPPPSGLDTLDYFGSSPGIWRVVRFGRVITVNHNPTRINLSRGGANIVTDVGDIGVFLSDATGVATLVNYTSAVSSSFLGPRTAFPITPTVGALIWTDGARQINTYSSGAVRTILSPSRRLFRSSARNGTVTFTGDALTTFGTPTLINAAATNVYTRQYRTSILSAAGVSQDASWESTFVVYPDDPGFFLVRFSHDNFQVGEAAFIGLKPAGVLGAVNPSNVINSFGVGANGGAPANSHLTFRRMMRNNVASNFMLDFGANFPSNTSMADIYEVQCWWNAGMARVWLTLLRTTAAGVQFVANDVVTPGTPPAATVPVLGTPLKVGLWTSTSVVGVAAIQPTLHEFVVEL